MLDSWSRFLAFQCAADMGGRPNQIFVLKSLKLLSTFFALILGPIISVDAPDIANSMASSIISSIPPMILTIRNIAGGEGPGMFPKGPAGDGISE